MPTYLDLLARAKKLVNDATPSEVAFRNLLTKNEVSFEFQAIFPPYIADFYIPNRALIVEIDGGIHNKSSQQWHDSKRDDYFLNIGVAVMRYENSLNPEENVEEVLSFFEADTSKVNRINKIRKLLINFAIKPVKGYGTIDFNEINFKKKSLDEIRMEMNKMRNDLCILKGKVSCGLISQ